MTRVTQKRGRCVGWVFGGGGGGQHLMTDTDPPPISLW